MPHQNLSAIYETIIQNTPDLIYAFDLNYRFTYANEALLTMWGLSWEESIGKNLRELGYEDWHANMHEREIDEIVATKKTIRGEVSFPHDVLGTRFYDYIFSPVLDDDGNVVLIAGTTRDITSQVEARNNITESEHQLRNMVEQAPVAICVLKGENYIVQLANESQLQLWGKQKEEVLNRPIFEALPESRGQGFEDLLASVYIQGETFKGSEMPITLVRNSQTETIYCTFAYIPLRNSAHQITGIMSVANEVTAEVIAKKKIEESEQKFQAAVKAVQGTLWTNSASGEMIGEQPGWASLTGQSYDEYQGYGWANAVHPEDSQPSIDVWQDAVKHRKTYIHEHRVMTSDAEYRYFATRAIPVLNDDGSIHQWVGIHIDIQDQKIAEEKKDEFISIASHEMKTPLTTAKAYLQMLELILDESDEEATLFAKKASQAINRLQTLINELLDVSKIRLGKLNYNITTFDFNDLINTTVDNMQLTEQTHTIVKTGEVINEITGDKDRLQQVVINLINNAIKYSPNADKVYVTVSQQNDQIQVSVKDTGIGISKSSLDKIFNKYHRVEEHAIRFQGLGIGLFICNEIIERHHGKLWAESEPGHGSTFHFTIPLNPRTPVQ